jgi:hypothetical protein
MGNKLIADDMAVAMENALKTLVTLPLDDDPVPRQKLFKAIAQGVVSHLKANEGAFSANISGVTPNTAKPISINA